MSRATTIFHHILPGQDGRLRLAAGRCPRPSVLIADGWMPSGSAVMRCAQDSFTTLSSAVSRNSTTNQTPPTQRPSDAYKRLDALTLVSSAAVQLPQFLLLPSRPQAWCRCYLSSFTTFSIIMFSKVALSTFAVGALTVNALAVPAARSPQPESECSRSSSLIPS